MGMLLEIFPRTGMQTPVRWNAYGMVEIGGRGSCLGEGLGFMILFVVDKVQ